MRFNSKAYAKLFPRKTDDTPKIETAVEGFTPTADEIKESQEVQDGDGTTSEPDA